jgi:hypothetical protein
MFRPSVWHFVATGRAVRLVGVFVGARSEVWKKLIYDRVLGDFSVPTIGTILIRVPRSSNQNP